MSRSRKVDPLSSSCDLDSRFFPLNTKKITGIQYKIGRKFPKRKGISDVSFSHGRELEPENRIKEECADSRNTVREPILFPIYYTGTSNFLLYAILRSWCSGRWGRKGNSTSSGEDRFQKINGKIDFARFNTPSSFLILTSFHASKYSLIPVWKWPGDYWITLFRFRKVGISFIQSISPNGSRGIVFEFPPIDLFYWVAYPQVIRSLKPY